MHFCESNKDVQIYESTHLWSSQQSMFTKAFCCIVKEVWKSVSVSYISNVLINAKVSTIMVKHKALNKTDYLREKKGT